MQKMQEIVRLTLLLEASIYAAETNAFDIALKKIEQKNKRELCELTLESQLTQ